jgi:glycosyltransferase involved in cell wall biosynthesis
MLKVVHIQKEVLSTGRAPFRLHNAFLERGYDSRILSVEFDVNLTDRITLVGRNSRIKSRIDLSLQSFIRRNLNWQYGLYSYPILGTDVTKYEMVREADVIYLHWVQGGFLNLSGYEKLAKLNKPVIVFMHDMWTITGGCHHSFSCDKYQTECFDCQMFKKKGLIDWASREFRKKKKLYGKYPNFYFVSPSRWLYDCTQRSFLTKGKPVFHIPNIIDIRTFKKIDKKFAREMLDLDKNDTIIAFGAFAVKSVYKGWPELLKALNILKSSGMKEQITVLVFGGGYNKEIADAIPFKTKFMGFLKDEYSTVLVYNASDVFVTPSLADNFPTTVLESQSCGTPVVGFNVGGIPDMIKHLDNGYLAKYRDPDDLAEGIKYCLDNKLNGRLLPEFDKSLLLDRHIALINSILK